MKSKNKTRVYKSFDDLANAMKSGKLSIRETEEQKRARINEGLRDAKVLKSFEDAWSQKSEVR